MLPECRQIEYHLFMLRRAKLLGSIVLGVGLLALAVRAGAELPPEEVGEVMQLPETAE